MLAFLLINFIYLAICLSQLIHAYDKNALTQCKYPRITEKLSVRGRDHEFCLISMGGVAPPWPADTRPENIPRLMDAFIRDIFADIKIAWKTELDRSAGENFVLAGLYVTAAGTKKENKIFLATVPKGQQIALVREDCPELHDQSMLHAEHYAYSEARRATYRPERGWYMGVRGYMWASRTQEFDKPCEKLCQPFLRKRNISWKGHTAFGPNAGYTQAEWDYLHPQAGPSRSKPPTTSSPGKAKRDLDYSSARPSRLLTGKRLELLCWEQIEYHFRELSRLR